MKKKITKQQFLKAALLAVAAAVVGTALFFLLKPNEIWVNGSNISNFSSLDQSLLAGAGRASYDRSKGILYLDNATLSQSHNNTSAVYCKGDLTINIVGDNIILGNDFGILVRGGLTVTGSGTLKVWGGDTGIFSTGHVTVEDGVDIMARGGNRSISAQFGMTVPEMDCVTGGSSEYDAVPDADCSNVQFAHIHVPVQLKFIGNGGKAPDDASFKWGSTIPAPVDGVREGYYFDGWFTDYSCKELFNFSDPLYEDTAVYAGWTKIVYITFDSWGGSEIPVIDIAINTALKEPETPEKTDQIFAGWYADDDLGELYDFSQPVTEDITLYAKWEKICDEVAYGIDVSSWQKKVDWKAAAADGVQFALLRAGFRGYGAEGSLNADDYFLDNLEGALAAGLDVGCYFYCQSTNEEEAVEEAEFLLELIGDHRLTLPVFLDFEVPVDSSGKEIGRLAEMELSGEEHAAICLAFCRRIEEAGFTAMVYAGKGHLGQDNMAGILDDAGYGVWLAHWRMQTNYPGKYVYWQYSAKGNVNGIKGDVDMDIRYIVTPEKVRDLTAESCDGGVSLAWERIPGCYAYAVYRMDADGEYVCIADVTGAGNTKYTDDDPSLTEGEEYSYCVKAYLVQNGTKFMGDFSEPALAVCGKMPQTEEAEN